MHHDHAQEFFRHVTKKSGNADLTFAFELVALHPRDGGVGAQGIADHMNTIVIHHLGEWRGAAQIAILDLGNVFLQAAFVAHAMRLGVAFAEQLAQGAIADFLLHMRDQWLGIGTQVGSQYGTGGRHGGRGGRS